MNLEREIKKNTPGVGKYDIITCMNIRNKCRISSAPKISAVAKNLRNRTR